MPDPAAAVRAAGARRVAWFHCFSGIAGDMAMGSLVDAGADLDDYDRLLFPRRSDPDQRRALHG